MDKKQIILDQIEGLKEVIGNLQQSIGLDVSKEFITTNYLSSIEDKFSVFKEQKVKDILLTDKLDKDKLEKSLDYFYSKIGEDTPPIIYVEDIPKIESSFLSKSGISEIFKIFQHIDIELKSINKKYPNSSFSYGKLYSNDIKKLDIQLQSGGRISFTAFFESIEDILLPLYLDKFLSEDAVNYINMLTSGIYGLYYDKRSIIAVKKPKITVKENLQIDFKNSSISILEGVIVPTDLLENIKNNKYTTEEFFEEKNEEVKSLVIRKIEEYHGEDSFYNFIKPVLEEVDTYVDKKAEKYLEKTTGGMNIGVYTLFKKGEYAFVRCYCPSTDRMFFLGVHPSYTNVKDAIASLYIVPEMLKTNISYIQRQGEMFSTVFEEEAFSKYREELSKGNDWRLRSMTTITGEEYFEKLTYEY